MTLVVGAVMKNETVLMADSCVFTEDTGDTLVVRKKLWVVPHAKQGECSIIVGFAGAWKDFVEYRNTWTGLLETLPHDASEEYFYEEIIFENPELFGAEANYDLLIGTKKAIYTLSSDGTIYKSKVGHGSIGSQADYALGYMDAKSCGLGLTPIDLATSMNLCTDRSIYIRAPFDTLRLSHRPEVDIKNQFGTY